VVHQQEVEEKVKPHLLEILHQFKEQLTLVEVVDPFQKVLELQMVVVDLAVQV
tara:strand:- start:24 stop:182 length:159 start_codon:yes stop_codon:yes gene_type:complete